MKKELNLRIDILHLFGKPDEPKSKETYLNWLSDKSVYKNLDTTLEEMINLYIHANGVENLSKFWLRLLCIHVYILNYYGFENFKQTLSRNYGISSRMDSSLFEGEFTKCLLEKTEGLDILTDLTSLFKKHTLFTHQESYIYNTITRLFYEYVIHKHSAKWLTAIEEPELGNSPFIKINNKNISQDLINSALDLSSISNGCDLNQVKTILEIGAGSGRLPFHFLNHFKSMKYIIVDIPPALYISQTYLTKIFPDKKIMFFKDFKNISEVEDELFSSDIVFLMPSQLEMLPPKCVNLAIAVNCLQEMPKQIVEAYFNFIDKISDRFFFKAYDFPPDPSNDNFFNFVDYPVKKNWEKIFNKKSDFPDSYSEALYLVK